MQRNLIRIFAILTLLSLLSLSLSTAFAMPNKADSAEVGTGVLGFRLINADTDKPIPLYNPIGHGEAINLALLPTRRLNLEVLTTAGAAGVELNWDGKDQSDTSAPFSVGGDSSGNFDAWLLRIGKHNLTAKPYTGTDSEPVLGSSLAISFTVVDGFGDCSKKLGQLIAEAKANAEVKVPRCIYRETVKIDKPLTLMADPGAEIRGSDEWKSWNKSGRYWVSSQVLTNLRSDDVHCAGDTTRCKWPEQVFFDGQPLIQVAANPSAGEFALSSRRQIMLADDPAGHLVEVTTRARWIVAAADNVKIVGFRMRHAANNAPDGAVSLEKRSGWTLQNNVFSDAHGAAVDLGEGSNNQLLQNDAFRNGWSAVTTFGGSGHVVRGNRIHDSNVESFNALHEAYGVAGLYFVGAQRLVVDGNVVYGNAGNGIWCRANCNGAVLSNNLVHHNANFGMIFETSDGARIFGNRIWENAWKISGAFGLWLSNVSRADVYNNVLAWNRNGIWVWAEKQPMAAWNTTTGNFVHDNVVISTAQMDGDPFGSDEDLQREALSWTQDPDWRQAGLLKTESNNRGESNLYWYPTAEGALKRFFWGYDRPFASLKDFNTTSGEEKGQYLSTAEKNDLLGSLGLPAFSKLSPWQ